MRNCPSLFAAAASLANADPRSVDDPAALTASIFTCLIAAREPEPSDEKLTLKPVGGSSDEEWDLWDHLNHLYNDGLVSYFNQIWTTYQDKHAKLTRNRVDLSYGVATTGKNAEQADSVFGERLVPCPWQWHAAAAAGGH